MYISSFGKTHDFNLISGAKYMGLFDDDCFSKFIVEYAQQIALGVDKNGTRVQNILQPRKYHCPTNEIWVNKISST